MFLHAPPCIALSPRSENAALGHSDRAHFHTHPMRPLAAPGRSPAYQLIEQDSKQRHSHGQVRRLARDTPDRLRPLQRRLRDQTCRRQRHVLPGHPFRQDICVPSCRPALRSDPRLARVHRRQPAGLLNRCPEPSPASRQLPARPTACHQHDGDIDPSGTPTKNEERLIA